MVGFGRLFSFFGGVVGLGLGLGPIFGVDVVGGGGDGGLGSGSSPDRITSVTPTTSLNLTNWPLQMRPSTAGYCRGSFSQAVHPANLPPLPIAHEGTGTGGDFGVDGEPSDPPTMHTSLENRGVTMSPFLIIFLPANFLHVALSITAEQ